MRKFLNLTFIASILLVISTLITSCGFHLRNFNKDYKFPFSKMYLDCQNVVICGNLRSTIVTESLVTLVSNPLNAEVVLKLNQEETSRVPQGFNSFGRISSYLLTYGVQATVMYKNEPLSTNIAVSSSMPLRYNDSLILSAQQEEANFWEHLHRSVTTKLIRRLVHLDLKTHKD